MNIIERRHRAFVATPDLTDDRAAWLRDAECRRPGVNPEAFFPIPDWATGPAKAICRQCPVVAPCLQWALDSKDAWGVLGGLSPDERRRLRRRQTA